MNEICILFLFRGILLLKKEGKSAMKEENCILCRRPAALGLHVMGCLICFSCERKLVHSSISPLRRRRLMKFYEGFSVGNISLDAKKPFPPAPLPGKPLGLAVQNTPSLNHNPAM